LVEFFCVDEELVLMKKVGGDGEKAEKRQDYSNRVPYLMHGPTQCTHKNIIKFLKYGVRF
jgi:fructose/tagatose bisphosphate aldolase